MIKNLHNKRHNYNHLVPRFLDIHKKSFIMYGIIDCDKYLNCSLI